MIDWHSHILPYMDDGSGSVAESIKLIDILSKQGVSTVVATPHFYANKESVDDFLKRRGKSWDRIKNKINNDCKIILGAEVKYYQGISHLEDLKKLCIEGTDILLLEMPFSRWTEYMITEIIGISKSGIKVVLVHIDRYLKFENKKIWKRLNVNEIMMQINADCFNGFFTRRKAIFLAKNGMVDFIGSDCHNTENRLPNIQKAYNVIKAKFGFEYLNQMDEYARRFLDD